MKPFACSILCVALTGCGGEVSVAASQTGCTDFNYSDPADPVLEWEATADHDASVWRANVLLDQAGATFAPDYAIDKGTLSIFEHWTDPASDDTFCYQPQVAISGIHGTLEVRWYTEDDSDVPFDTVEIKP